MPLKQSHHGSASNENANADNCQIPSSILVVMEWKSPLLDRASFFFFNSFKLGQACRNNSCIRKDSH